MFNSTELSEIATSLSQQFTITDFQAQNYLLRNYIYSISGETVKRVAFTCFSSFSAIRPSEVRNIK